MTPRLLIPLAMAALVLAPEAAGSPEGYFIDPVQARAPREASLEKLDGEYTMSIRRDTPDAGSAHLLDIAEATYPPREALVNLAIRHAYEVGPDSSQTPLWWCDGVGMARVPYALTLAAVQHYARLTDEFRRGVFWGAGVALPRWSELTYRATIRRKAGVTAAGESFNDVYVAELLLDWRYDDGAFTSVVGAHRIVVLSPRGKLLAVEGDGASDEEISISHTERGRPPKWLR